MPPRSREERARIGSELQDIIAHSVSAMVIQAGGARRRLRSDPERARDSILNVEHTGRDALADLRRLLGMLRKDDDPRALAPQPGLNQLGALIDSVRDAGLACELRIRGRAGRPDTRRGPRRLPGDRGGAASPRRQRSAAARVVTIRLRPHELELDIRGRRHRSRISTEAPGQLARASRAVRRQPRDRARGLGEFARARSGCRSERRSPHEHPAS